MNHCRLVFIFSDEGMLNSSAALIKMDSSLFCHELKYYES